MRRAVAIGLVVFVATSAAARAADWQPPAIRASHAVLADVLAAIGRASGNDDPRLAQRHERWTYVVGHRSIPVTVSVRNDDFRTSLQLDALPYEAGRLGGARWRSDGNGVVHGVQADLQGDALDRAPQALFRIDPATCTLAGEADIPGRAWVVATHPAGDKEAFLYVDAATGFVVREIERDGKNIITTTFDHFEPVGVGTAVRSRHWIIDDGRPAERIDVMLEAIEPGPVDAAEVGFPARRTFAPRVALTSSVDLPAAIERGFVFVDVRISGKRARFLLDTGTPNITISTELAGRYGETILQHTVLPELAVGPLRLEQASALSIPFWGDGILGLDFFIGHVIEIDFRRGRVRVLSDQDAREVFREPGTTIVPANVDQGVPLAHAALGRAQSEYFVVDTGSPHLYVMQPFEQRYADVIASEWKRTGTPYVVKYLEGGIEVQPFRVPRFTFGDGEARDIIVGEQVPTKLTDDLDFLFDGIIGTDILSNFDVFVDYDNARLGLRH